MINLKSRDFSKTYLAVGCAFLVFVVWVGVTPRHDELGRWAQQRTNEALQVINKAIHRYQSDNKKVPGAISEIRAFGLSEGMDISTYDGYGEKIQYIRLAENDYFIRSFGEDRRQNALFNEADPFLSHWNKLPDATPFFRYMLVPKMKLYPGQLVLGADAPNKKWYAQLHTDRISYTRRLVVRRRGNEMFLVAPHDFIEEFIWLPNSYEIIYTATSSLRYRDGIYRWNILKDEVTNLLTGFESAAGLYVNNPENRYFMSLGGASADGRFLYVYLAPDLGTYLNPNDFLNAQQFFQIDLLESQKPKLALSDKSKSPLTPPFDVHSNVVGSKQGDRTFDEWSALRFRGPLLDVIHGWQNFASNHGESPALPYCLWYLSSMYADGFRMVKRFDPDQAHVLRSYGVELARGLERMPSAPSYLRAFGGFIFERLSSGESLPYRVSDLKVKRELEDL